MLNKIFRLFFILFLLFSFSFSEEISHNFKNTKELDFSLEELEYIKDKKDIYIANEFDWLPFDFYENNVPKGYVVDYMKVVSKKLGLNPIFVTKKWGALVKSFKNKKIDVLPVLSYNKKREKYLNFSQSFYTQDLSITIKKSRDDIISIDDLKYKKIGMIKGWNTTNIIKHDYPEINVIEFDSINDIFDAIQNDFVDASIQNHLLSNYYINQNYFGVLKNTKKISIKGFDSKLYMGVGKDLSILLTLINKAINSISKEELIELERKWIKTSSNTTLTSEEINFIRTTKINAVTGKDWAPFTFEENGKARGISVDLWKYIVDKTKLNTSLSIRHNYFNMKKSLKAKEHDIILASAEINTVDKKAIYSNASLTTPIGIATLLDKNYIKSAKDLLGKKVAVGKSYSAHKILESEYPTMDFVFVTSGKEGLEYVSKNKAYAYVDIMPVLTYGIEKYGFTNIRVSGQTGRDFKLSSMIRADYPLLKSIIDKTIKNMTFEEKQKVFNRWLKVKVEKEFDYTLLWKIVAVFSIILLFVIYRNKQLKNYQKELEKANIQTQNSLDNFKTLMNLNLAGILIIKNRKIIYVNDEIIRMLGFPKTQLLNKEISVLFSFDDLEKVNFFEENFKESYNLKSKKSIGKEIPVLLRNNNIMFENQDSILLSLIDLSDIKNKEEILIQQSKLASLGEMIGNIAHQWRQPLSYISTAASGMKIQKEYNTLTDKDFFKLTDVIVETTMFLSQTIDDFRYYTEGKKIKRNFELKVCMIKILSMMESTFTKNFIKINNNTEDITIYGYENELSQVFLNLFSNANDALLGVNKDSRNIFINAFNTKNNVIIEIIDTGGGINKDILNKVFEPYFTTKHKSQGTGLGLYITYNVVKKSIKGDIKIENISYINFEKCTKITLFIPKK